MEALDLELITTIAGVIIAIVFGYLSFHISRAQTQIAESQKQIAKEQTRLVEEQNKLAENQQKTQEQQLSLATIREGVDILLRLKSKFAENPEVFEKQLDQNPSIRRYIPPHMDVQTFMIFASDMWLLSALYSVITRAEAHGLSPGEREGFVREQFLWLRNVPGFYDVYCYHTSQLQAHNPDFLSFLETQVFDEDFRRDHPQRPTNVA